MDRVEVSTVVYLPPEEIYEFLEDFPRYARYSKYLDAVEQNGDGGPGTQYDLTFAWWKVSYTARSAVTAVDPPDRIEWELVKDLEAHGRWQIDPDPDATPPDREAASRVRFVAEFDPSSTSRRALDLPRLISFDWLVGKVKPLILEEAERVVERIVADIEGERREVELTIHETPSSV